MSANPKLTLDSTLYQLGRRFNNQRNAQHTFAVHYKYLRPVLQLLVNLTFSVIILRICPTFEGYCC